MDRNDELHDDDRTDLGAASVETKGQIMGNVPDGFDRRVGIGMTDE